MKNLIESFSLFLLPFSLAVGLILIKGKIFVPDESAVTFGLSDNVLPLEKQIYDSLIAGLFILSLILPAFAVKRSEPIQRNEIKLKDI